MTAPAAAPAGTHPAVDDTAAGTSWQLVQRAQAGDAEAFGQIWCRYRKPVFRFVYYRVGNLQVAEDLTADTFERALKRIDSFTWQGRDLGAWLVTIARNLVVDHFKAGVTKYSSPVGGPIDFPAELAGDEPAEDTAVGRLLHRQRSGVLAAAMRQLTAEQREVLELRFWAGLTVLQTAAKLGLTEGACKAVQYRAVRALAKQPAVQELLPGLVPA